MNGPPVKYVTTNDGYSIAYTVSGTGLPFVFIASAHSHVQLHWTSPQSYLHDWLVGLSTRFQLIHYDSRGLGMSRRGVGSDYSMAAFGVDLTTVIDHLQLDGLVLMGDHHSAHAAISYAIANPGRVRALVLAPCGVSGRAWPVISAVELAAQNWDFFLSLIATSASAANDPALVRQPWDGAELVRQSVTQSDWQMMARVWSASNIEAKLPMLVTPTLVLHPRGYLNVPVAESTKLASLISNARLALIDGDNPLGDAAAGIRAIEDFLGSLPVGAQHRQTPGHSAVLSAREIEVLRLVAAGRSNQQIADDLVISLNTVRRHMTNIFGKTGTVNRAGAASYAHQHSLT